MDNGFNYEGNSMILLSEENFQPMSLPLDIKSSIEDWNHSQPLLNTPSSKSTLASTNGNVQEVEFGPIVCFDRAGNHAPLDAEYLPTHIVLAQDPPENATWNTAGTLGTSISSHKKYGVLFRVLNAESGVAVDVYSTPSALKRITKVYGQALEGPDTIYTLVLSTEKALSTHYARNVLISLVQNTSTQM